MTSERKVAERVLGRQFVRLYPEEVAAELERLALQDAIHFLENIPSADAVGLVSRLTPDMAGQVVAGMRQDKAAAVVAALDTPAAASLLARIDAGLREGLLALLPPEMVADLRQLASYPPHTAGALMDPEVLALHPHMTAQEGLKRLRAMKHKQIHRIFLVDPDHRLQGSVRIRDLAVAGPSTKLGQLMVSQPAGVRATASRAEVVEALTRSRVASLPVVNLDGQLLGVLRHNALLDVTREEATVDIQSMVGAGKEERALSKISFAVRRRLPWLQVNLGTAFLAAGVVGLFESTIARYTALAVLLPVVAGQSGNTGAQALAVTMRALALREIRTRQWFRICFKEVNVGLINGVAVALTTSVAVWIWSQSLGMALVIGSSMVISMASAGLSGAAIPLLLHAAGQDPAQSSSIILTTITDVVGFMSFLGIATLFAGLL